MQDLSGSGLTPLFHSEITSSYMLFDIFHSHPDVARQLINEIFGIMPENILVQRERAYPKKGSIDVFIEFTSGGERSALLIEVKVHDYLSATGDQIQTYFNAVVADGSYANVFFIYLTQFNEKTAFIDCAAPRTIDEARKGRALIGSRFVHVSWPEMHAFLSGFVPQLTEEQRLMVELQRTWITAQSNADLEENRVDVGIRPLSEYFPDITTDIRILLPFGREVSENRRQIWRVDVAVLDSKGMDTLLTTIGQYIGSARVNRLKQYPTADVTLRAARDFLAELAQGEGDWLSLSFYARLFDLIERCSYVKFNGTGGRGFSIKLDVQGKGEISLCTLNRNRSIDFSMKR